MKILSKRAALKKLKQFKGNLKYIRHINDDILTSEQKEKLDSISKEADNLNSDDLDALTVFIDKAPLRLVKHLPKKRFPIAREYMDVFAVALMVAMGLRALFLQPFKIPTSSMQPTLFGIHYVDGKVLPKNKYFNYIVNGASEAKLIVKQMGYCDTSSFQTYTQFLSPFTRLEIGGVTYDLPGTIQKVLYYTKLQNQLYKKGDVLADGWLSTGDHLFVDRVSHHFVGFKRGDVIVFTTKGLINYNNKPLDHDGVFYYIKRLIGLPGDQLRNINNMIYVKPKGGSEFVPITKLAPIFKKVYSRKGGYHGHTYGSAEAQFLTNPKDVFTVPKDHYFAMGDNSINSLDSRYWGAVPRKNMLGKAFFIFYPFSRRWGIADRLPPIDVSTSAPGMYSDIKEMHLQ